jgi:Asp-tRNA(Asn)/Glu-tRNA(Gln) amidotransferase A subunit family amidase
MPDQEPIFWPITQLIAAYESGELSPVEVTRAALDRIKHFDPDLHSYLAVTPELALAQAKSAAELYGRNDSNRQPLLGVPLSIKDLFDVLGEPTTLGSLAYGRDEATADSQPVSRLRAAGSVFLGKSNTAEFGQSATTDNLLGPDCGNPWDPGRTSGGSSGGAAASVAAGLASAALGSDGGGSIRIPAAMCGLFGIKPTFVGTPEHDSFRAMTEFVSSGPITRSVADARILLSVLLERSFVSQLPGRRRIAWSPTPLGQAVDPAIRLATARAIDLLAGLGHQIEEVQLPIERWREAFGPLVLADEWRYRRHLLEDRDQLTHYVRKGIEAGEAVTEAEIGAARVVKQEVTANVEALFDNFDVIITPTTACVAFPIGTRPTEIDGQSIDPLWGPFPFTAAFNVSGSPAGSVPVGLSDGVPIGLQVIAAHHREDMVLDVAQQIEQTVDFPGSQMYERWAYRTSSGALT